MRPLRNFKPNRCYHLISRIANRAFFLTDRERMRFVDRLWRVAKFSGIEVLAYCFMSNHFHFPYIRQLKLQKSISPLKTSFNNQTRRITT